MKTAIDRISYYTRKVKQEVCDTPWQKRKSTRAKRLLAYKAAMHAIIEAEKKCK